MSLVVCPLTKSGVVGMYWNSEPTSLVLATPWDHLTHIKASARRVAYKEY